MGNFILRRIFYSVWVIFGVLLLTFLLFNLAAGDPAAAVLGKDARPEEVESLQDELGSNLPLFYGNRCRTSAWVADGSVPQKKVTLRRAFPRAGIYAVLHFSDGSVSEKIPLPETEKEAVFSAPEGKSVSRVEIFRRQSSAWDSQFFRGLREFCHTTDHFPYLTFFDFGRTLMTRETIRSLLWHGMGPSLSLMLPIFAGEIGFGIFFALIASAFSGRWPDRTLLLLSVAGMSFSYLTAIIFGQWLFGYYLEWFPVWGYGELRNFALPILIGILCGVGNNVRFFRTVFSDELAKEYLRTAKAKGLASPVIYGKHLLRNASVQVITRASAGLPFLFTGSLLLESFFGIPGLGFAGIEALRNSDIQLLKALVLLSAVLCVVINLLADLAYAWFDPRIKLE